MEVELRRVHRETGATWLYVTHDQREALALSDRIAVFDRGRIDQLDDPTTIYRRPATPYAAGFVGNANVIPCEVEAALTGRTAHVADVRVDVGPEAPPGPAWLILRPESLAIGTAAAAGSSLNATVRDVAYRGTAFSYLLEAAGIEQMIKAEVADAPEHPLEIGASVRSAGATTRRSVAARGMSPPVGPPGPRADGELDDRSSRRPGGLIDLAAGGGAGIDAVMLRSTSSWAAAARRG